MPVNRGFEQNGGKYPERGVLGSIGGIGNAGASGGRFSGVYYHKNTSL